MTYLLVLITVVLTVFACSADGAHVVDIVASKLPHQRSPVEQNTALLVMIHWFKAWRVTSLRQETATEVTWNKRIVI